MKKLIAGILFMLCLIGIIEPTTYACECMETYYQISPNVTHVTSAEAVLKKMNRELFKRYNGINEVDMRIIEEYETDIRKIEIYDTNDLDAETLESREINGKLIVERLYGVVLNEQGDGELLDCKTEFNYISYRSIIDSVNVGDVICTYVIYNPENDYVDDIIERWDWTVT